MRVLILGGTAEARELAQALHDRGVEVTTSLAGRTGRPRLPSGAVRIGGFGGAAGLRRWVGEHAIDTVVDATHPFAERISAAAAHCGAPLLRLERPGSSESEGDRWTWVDDLPQAAAACTRHRVLLTTGRRELAPFATAAWLLIRCISTPEEPLPEHAELLLDRGPFSLDGERDLLARHAIDLVVTKDSGGPAPKLDAARERGLHVIMVRRPRKPPADTVSSVEEALRRF